VWNQLASHDVVQRVPGPPSADQPPLEMLRLVLQVEHGGYVVSSTAGERFEIPKDGDAYDTGALRERLSAYRSHDPNRQDLIVASEDGVIFEHLVEAMDAARGAGFTTLSLSES
jgi:biopolymer transport protein ExbD